MKKSLLSLICIFLLSALHAQWSPQMAPANTGNLYSVFSMDTNVAAVGATKVLRTSNSGNTWLNPVTLGGVNLYEVHTKNPTRFYSLTQNSSWYVKISIFGSTTLQSNKPDSILSLHYINMACGVAVGTAGKIETTCDTGMTWSFKTSGTTNALNAIWFSDADTGITVGVSGTIKRTKDAGNTWSNITSGTAQSLNAIHFPSATVGYIAGTGGVILKTTNAGRTWTTLASGVINTLNGIFFTHVDTGYVVGAGGLIMKTVDGGLTWGNMNSGTVQPLNSVHFTNPTTGWVVGNNAVILKYVPGVWNLGMQETKTENLAGLYPNPAKDKINVLSAKASTLKIYNALGEMVYESLQSQTERTVDVSSLAPGVYFAELNDQEKTLVKKFIKE